MLSGLLLLKKPSTGANMVLAFIVLDPAIAMMLIIMMYYKTAANYPVVYYISYLYDFLCPSFFYYYVLLVLHKETRFRTGSLVHLFCFTIGLAYFIWLALQPYAYRHGLLLRTQTDKYPWQFYILDYLTILQYAVYLPVCYVIIWKHNRKIEQAFSNTVNLSTKWLQQFCLLALILGTVMYFPLFIGADFSWYLILVPLASLVLYCYLVYKAICFPIVFPGDTLKIIEHTENENIIKRHDFLPTENDVDLANILESLFRKEKLFLDADLNIQTLAERCNTRVHTLSVFINNYYKKSFFDYINSYRIEEAKTLLTDPGNQKYSINTIAESSGFSSRSSFYKAFKKNTNLTPGEYLKEQKTGIYIAEE
jgi:AraC-like DNA-binding protein